MSSCHALVGALAVLPCIQSSARGRWEVDVARTIDGPLVTVHADEASPLAVLREIARETELVLSGEDRLTEAGTLTAYLERRPLEPALTWILGSLGLRASISDGELAIVEELPPFPPRERIDEQAELAWLRAVKHAPEHERADRAELALAEIAERTGRFESAVKHYQYLVESFPDSELVPEVLWRASEHLMRAKEWSRAAGYLAELAEHPEADEHRSRARLALATVHCHRDDPKRALYLVDALDRGWPAQEPGETRARLLVRARALALDGEAVEALRVLDVMPPEEPGVDDAYELLEVRALALERCGKFSEAALAWLSFARSAPADVRGAAIESAARLTLAAEDEVGVLLIEAWGREVQSEADLAAYADEARMRLGLAAPDPTNTTDAQWLSRGEELLQRGSHAEAARTLEPLYHRRSRLTEEERLRLARSLAPALEAAERLGYAIEVLREVAGTLEQRDRRGELYVLASQLYEKNARYEEAMEALQGRL